MSSAQFPRGLATLTVTHRSVDGRYRVPEYSEPTGLHLEIFQVIGTELSHQTSMNFSGDTEITTAHHMIVNEGWPLLTFNAFNFDYRILASRLNLDYYLKNTIDLFYGLWLLINHDAIQKTGEKVTENGDLRYLPLLMANLPHHVPESQVQGRSLAQLWHRIMRQRHVVVAGKQHKISNAIGMKLIGHTPFFPNTGEWASPLIHDGSLLGSRSRGHTDQQRSFFSSRYASYV